MNFRQRVGLAWGPLPLRLGLAIAFIWAGAGKIFETTALTSSQAGMLASMGVSLPGASPVEPPAAPPSEKAPPANVPRPDDPADAPPKPSGPDAPLPAPDAPKDPASDPERAAKVKRSGAGGSGGAAREAPAKAADRSRKSQATVERVRHVVPVEGMVDLEPPRVAARVQETPVAAGGAGSGGDEGQARVYPDGLRVRAVYRLALLLRSASEPARPAGDATAVAPAGTPMPLWPSRLAQGRLPVYFAWSVALTELLGGVFVLAGLITRLSALSLGGIMLGAVWLTQVGPAVQSGKATLGFLPAHPAFDIPAWMPLQWQVSLLCMSAALFFIGPGSAALDNILWSGGGERKKPGPPAAPRQA